MLYSIKEKNNPLVSDYVLSQNQKIRSSFICSAWKIEIYTSTLELKKTAFPSLRKFVLNSVMKSGFPKQRRIYLIPQSLKLSAEFSLSKTAGITETSFYLETQIVVEQFF